MLRDCLRGSNIGRWSICKFFLPREPGITFPIFLKIATRMLPLADLKHCSPEVIASLDNFYNLVDEMCWKLRVTEEMPATVEDSVNCFIVELERLYETLNLYIAAELDPAA